jgi:hypothetical protein
MLFFMVGASHLPIAMDLNNVTTYWIAMFVVWGALQFNGMKGKLGPMTTVNGVIGCGFGLTAVIYLMMEIIL